MHITIKKKLLGKIESLLSRKKFTKSLYKVFPHSSYPLDNIFYCCTQKTASQWFKAIFNDSIIFKHTGCDVYPFNNYLEELQKTYPNKCKSHWDFGPYLYNDFKTNVALPRKKIATHFYMCYSSYDSIPKPNLFKTFYILRDPRDITISWYYSTLYSHSPIGKILDFRKDLEKKNLSDGINYSIKTLHDRGIFNGQRSWLTLAATPQNLRIFRYEDFAEDNNAFLKKLLTYLNINLSEREFNKLCTRHQFMKYSSGRNHGEENLLSHYRRGISGDWKNYFSKNNIEYFKKITGDLLKILGYDE